VAGVDADAQARLEIERERLARRVEALRRELDAIVNASETANLDDEHDPEGATVGFERAQVIALLEDARRNAGAVDVALERMRAGTYGRCCVCGGEITAERLVARPTATECVTCAGRRSTGAGRAGGRAARDPRRASP
jgi:RNA polymerase-binding transcription factor DksA